LQQSWFTATSTNFIGGVPFDIRTFAVGSTEAQLLGARALTPETSKNRSAGITWTPIPALTVTADAYQIDIADRVVLSDNFVGDSIRAFFGRNGITGIGGGRFFTNAIDTRTRGVDVVASYARDWGARGLSRFTAGYSQNKTNVTRERQVTPPQLGDLSEVLFSRVEEGRIEIGQPRTNLILSATHEVSKFTFTVRGQRFGSVTSLQPAAQAALDQTFSAKWITDVSLGLQLRSGVQFTMGADNLFDVYPDQNSNLGNPAAGVAGNSNFGIFRYPGISPFGFNGRFVYARLNIRL
ncbi:MAG: TonB-dependent receptor, partial [Gemmatimonadaceae bacterium]|nr:TonB-dependent receptor [Gemmatimonadaceae bacterium]